MLAETKRPFDVLDAFAAALGDRPDAMLVYAGGAPDGMEDDLRARMRALGLPTNRVIFTGRTDAKMYRLWVAPADSAVQLRCMTRGETSGAIADCLAAGLPVVGNAHGSAAELPPDALILLPDEAPEADIAHAIRRLADDAGLRADLSARGLDFVRRVLSPIKVAADYASAIERFWTQGPQALRADTTVGVMTGDVTSLDALVAGLSGSFVDNAPGRILIDATNMAKCDLGTGIQRVIREIGKRILTAPPACMRAEIVRLDGDHLRHARGLSASFMGVADYGLRDDVVHPRPGDVIVLMDHHGEVSDAECASLRRAQRRGAQVVLFLHDILPLTHPQWFPPKVLPALQRWPEKMLALADRVVCTTHDGVAQVRAWYARNPAIRLSLPPLEVAPLGADFERSVTLAGNIADARVVSALRTAEQGPALLMVGTVEPRKGYAQALAAFEEIWANGIGLKLTIVGKPGWMMEAFCERLRSHREAGRRLHWLESCDDVALQAFYGAHAGLLMASEGEGFGLPLVEAAHYRLPVLARDIGVFREIGGDAVSWFSGDTAADLAQALIEWREKYDAATLPDPRGMAALSWDDSTASLLRAVVP